MIVGSKSSGFRDLSLILGGRFGAILIGLLYQAVLARTLGPAGRGSFEASMLFGSLLFLIFNVGAEMSVIYLISSNRLSAVGGITNGLFYVLLISILAIGIGALLVVFPSHLLGGMYSKATPTILYLGLLAGAATLMAQTVMAITSALKYFKVYSAMMMADRAMGLTFIVLFAVFMDIGVASALLAIIFSKLLIMIISLVIYGRRLRAKWELPTPSALRAFFSYGSRFYAGNLSNQINFRFGPLILLLFATQAELGFYGQALAIALYFMVLPDALYTIFLPRASENAEQMVKTFAQTGRVILLYSILILVGVQLFSKIFFELVLSKSFLPSVPLFKILVLGFAARAFGKAYEPYLVGTDRPGKVSLAVAAGAVTNILLLFVLMPELGVEGAAWALVGNYCVSTVIIVSIFMSTTGLGFWRSLMPNRDDVQLVKSVFSKFR